MTRKLKDIVASLRAEIANPAITATMIQTEDLAKLCNAAVKTRKQRKPSPEAIDRMMAAFNREHERWCWRRVLDKSGFELVRNSSPKNNINADEYFQITPLSKRYCSDRHEAEMWLGIWRGRAAMVAALEAL